MSDFKCKFCGKEFAQKYNRDRHEKFDCKDNQKRKTTKFECITCGKNFGRKDTLLKHINKKRCKGPEPSKTHDCEECGKKFQRPSHLRRHMVVHERPEFSCETCGRSFKRKDFLENHDCGSTSKRSLSFEDFETICFDALIPLSSREKDIKMSDLSMAFEEETNKVCDLLSY